MDASRVESIDDVKTIRIDATFEVNGVKLKAVAFKMDQDKIRLSLEQSIGAPELRIIFADGKLERYQESDIGFSELKVDAAEQASDLFDLLVLTPNYHFSQKAGFDQDTPVFDGYQLVLKRAPNRAGDVGLRVLKSVELHQINAETGVLELVRTATFSWHPRLSDTPATLSKIVFSDASSDEETTVHMSNVDYNIQVTHFMFGLPTPPLDLEL